MLSGMSVQEDHVQILVQISPRESVAKVVKRLKGGTSKIIRSEFPELAGM
jgi:putative transposase